MNFGVLAMTVLLALPSFARAESTRTTNPNLIGVEMLGRAGLFSVSYDRAIGDSFAIGLGYGSVALKNRLTGTDLTGATAYMVPIYGNYYWHHDSASLFLTVGANLILDHHDSSGRTAKVGGVDFGPGCLLPTAGIGYETRGYGGFLFRVTGYAVFGDQVTPWVGFTFGHAF